MPRKTHTPRRSRGAQPGNRNAFIHGLYARRLPIDRAALAAADLPPSNSLDDEIAMLRLIIRDLVARCADPQEIGVELVLLRTLSFAFAALNRMIKTRYFIADSSSTLQNIMHQALDQVRRDNPDSILNTFDDPV